MVNQQKPGLSKKHKYRNWSSSLWTRVWERVRFKTEQTNTPPNMHKHDCSAFTNFTLWNVVKLHLHIVPLALPQQEHVLPDDSEAPSQKTSAAPGIPWGYLSISGIVQSKICRQTIQWQDIRMSQDTHRIQKLTRLPTPSAHIKRPTHRNTWLASCTNLVPSKRCAPAWMLDTSGNKLKTSLGNPREIKLDRAGLIIQMLKNIVLAKDCGQIWLPWRAKCLFCEYDTSVNAKKKINYNKLQVIWRSTWPSISSTAPNMLHIAPLSHKHVDEWFQQCHYCAWGFFPVGVAISLRTDEGPEPHDAHHMPNEQVLDTQNATCSS